MPVVASIPGVVVPGRQPESQHLAGQNTVSIGSVPPTDHDAEDGPGHDDAPDSGQ